MVHTLEPESILIFYTAPDLFVALTTLVAMSNQENQRGLSKAVD